MAIQCSFFLFQKDINYRCLKTKGSGKYLCLRGIKWAVYDYIMKDLVIYTGQEVL